MKTLERIVAPTRSEQGLAPAIELVSVSKWQGVIAAIEKRYVRNESLQTLIELFVSFRNVRSIAEGSILGRPLSHLLKDVSLVIGRGSVVGVMDVGGQSRFALLQILGNTEPPSRGEVRYFGKMTAFSQIGLISFPHLSSRDILKRSARALGIGRYECCRAIDKLDEFSGLGSLLDTPFRRLQKGVFIDIGISFLCCLDYDILIADEVNKPTAKRVTAGWHEYLRRAPARGRTVILTSRNLKSLSSYCTHLLLLKDTRLLDYGSVEDMTSRHEAFIQEAIAEPLALEAERSDSYEEDEEEF